MMQVFYHFVGIVAGSTFEVHFSLLDCGASVNLGEPAIVPLFCYPAWIRLSIKLFLLLIARHEFHRPLRRRCHAHMRLIIPLLGTIPILVQLRVRGKFFQRSDRIYLFLFLLIFHLFDQVICFLYFIFDFGGKIDSIIFFQLIFNLDIRLLLHG